MLRKTKVKNGELAGLPAADPRITVYKGIPFAVPPVGELRWRAPLPAADWKGLRKCHTFGPMAMQNKINPNPEKNLYDREWHVDPDQPMSEDCLYLNVWTPAKSTAEKLPVYVWIYGGGLASGYTAEMEFDGERLSRRGIVVVTIAYRVNVFGFMAHPEITAENPDAPSNFGFFDQRAGIEWTKQNISAFGGDPDNITVGGQSMGGFSVAAQIASPLNKGLFQKAIMQSGYWQFYYTPQRFGGYPLKEAEEIGVKFFEHIGVKTLKEARQIEAFDLFERAKGFRGGMGGGTGVVTDGVFLTKGVYNTIEQGEGLHIPILLGNTGAEFYDQPSSGPGESIHAPSPAKTKQEFEACIKDVFGDKAEAFMNICSKNGDSIEDMMKTAAFQSTELVAHITAKQNVLLGNPYKLFYYIFDAYMPGWDEPGAFHSADLWFFFETLAKCWRPFDGKYYDLARLMCNYWANFIKTGDPNGLDADGSPMPEWTALTPETANAMIFTENGAKMDEKGPSDVIKFITEDYVEKINRHRK